MVRGLIVALLLAAAIWRGWIDWERTIGAGYAYRFTSIGGALAEVWPASTARILAAWQSSEIRYFWDPLGATLMALPLAPVLAGLAALLWLTRRKRRT